MNIASHRPSIHYKGEELGRYDAVIPRIGASVTFYGTAVLLGQVGMLDAYPSTNPSPSPAPATSCAPCNSWPARASVCR